MSMKVFARWAKLIRGISSIQKKNTLNAYGRLIGLVSRYVKFCHKNSDGMRTAPKTRTGNLSVPMRYQRLIIRYRMLNEKKRSLKIRGKFAQMCWKYLNLKTKPQRRAAL